MKRFVIDDLREIVSHCGMDGVNHDGGIVATVCHSALTVMVSHGSMRALVCYSVQWYNGLSWWNGLNHMSWVE